MSGIRLKTAAPESVTKDRGLCAFLARRERPAHRGIHAQHREEARRDGRRHYAYRVSGSGHRDGFPAEGSDPFKGARPLLEFEILPVVDAVPAGERAGLLRIGDEKHALRAVEGKRAQEHSVDHRENRRIGTDAEGQGENRERRKPGRPAQAAKRVADVLPRGFDTRQDVGFVHPLFGQRPVAQPHSGIVPGRFRRHSRIQVVAGARIDVKLQLLIELAVELVAAQQV